METDIIRRNRKTDSIYEEAIQKTNSQVERGFNQETGPFSYCNTKKLEISDEDCKPISGKAKRPGLQRQLSQYKFSSNWRPEFGSLGPTYEAKHKE